MRRALIALGPLLAAATPAAAASVATHPTQVAALTVAMPSEFTQLAAEQQVVADVFFGGRSIGQFEIVATPGAIRLREPDALVARLAGVSDLRAVRDALGGTLDSNARFVCHGDETNCARPQPDVAAVVFDQQRFRLDLYVNPKLMLIRPVVADRYLAPPSDKLALVDTVGGAIVGGSDEKAEYSITNRAILSYGNARIVSETTSSTDRRIDVDTLALEVDRPGLRYSAGVFYVPGADLVGRRRIVGAGIETQFDTRTDRTELQGSPLVVSLGQRSRVDLYVEGRLVSSHLYEAGNQAIDTSTLPDGSYPIEIRIQEIGGAARSEQRFFTKSTTIPPSGHTVFFANAGLLAVDDEHRWLGIAHLPIATAGAARRIGSHFAWDATLMATSDRQLAEVGLSWLTAGFQARAAVLGSAQGDYAALLQATSASTGRLGYSFDLRHVQSSDGRPLIPLEDVTPQALALTQTPGQNMILSGTTFTQMIGTIGYRIGRAQIGMTGYLRHDIGQPTSYSAGPTMHWSMLQRERMQLSFDGSFAQTDRGRAVAFGLRLQIVGARSSVFGSVGAQNDNGDGRLSSLADIGGSIQRDHVLGGQASLSGNAQQSNDGTVVQATADERGSLGYASGTLVHRFDGDQSTTQYGMTLQTVVAATKGALRVGAHDQNDSVIAVRIDGKARDGRFEVLVDGAPAGVLRVGERLTVAVIPYRRYTVRIRPIGGGLVAFDTRMRTVDVFPGTVAVQSWTADPVVAMFGRMVRPDGTAIQEADIAATGAISATDERGYFQIQAARVAVLTVRSGDGGSCRAAIVAPRSDKPFTPLGDVTCRP